MRSACLAVGSCLLLAACTKTKEDGAPAPSLTSIPEASAAAPAALETDLPPPSDDYYGIYLQGAKVGWMRNRVTVGEAVEVSVELQASVGGMGMVSQLTLKERRTYGKRDRRLQGLHFSQGAATGEVEVHGRREGEQLKIQINAGGATRSQTVKVEETLDDALAAVRLAKEGKVGQSATSRRYDPSVQKVLTVRHRVTAMEKKMFGGVEVEAVRLESENVELGITESSWLDRSGTALELRVGGFFVARLEPADVAKKLDHHQDLLLEAVVRTPGPIPEPQQLTELEVGFKGFGEQLPPSSSRQKVKTDGQEVVLKLSREEELPALPIDSLGRGAGEYLESTAFIQADAVAIKRAARDAVGGAEDLRTAITRLTHFVFSHVEDEYVPAYSNALEALQSRRGDCTEHSILFVALARSLGIPARVAVGIAYWPPGNGFGWHAWAEVRAGGRWYAVDPTWDQPIADATHIKLAQGGPAEQARIVMLLGQLEVTSLETR